MSIKEDMLLAEFLGWEMNEYEVKIPYQMGNEQIGLNPMDYLKYQSDISDLCFHNDWNWLMLVVEKINTTEGGRFTFQIMSMDVEIHDYLKGCLYIDFFSGNTPDQLIKSVYEACVEFVKKYNNE